MFKGQELELLFKWTFIFTWCAESNERIGSMVLDSSTMEAIKVKFRIAEAPAWEYFCENNKVSFSFNCIVVILDGEVLSLKVWSK